MLEKCEHMRPGRFAYTVLALFALLTTSLTAQPVRGIGDDALTAPRGAIRMQLSTSITDFSQRYGKGTPGRADGALEPLGVDFTTDTLGVALFPGLGPLQSALRTLTGNNAFTLNLGRSSLSSSVRTQTTPILLEAGITNRLSLSVLVPIVSARRQSGLNLNPLGVGGNVSFNPVRIATTSEAAVATNVTLVTQLNAARDQLAAQLASCNANPGSNPNCPSVIATAPSITANATAFAQGITQIYGTTVASSTAARFVPYATSGADSAIRNRVTTFRTQFQQFGITALAAGTLGPARAVAAMTPDGFQRAIGDSSLGLQAQPLNTVTRQGLGDVEVAVKLRLFDSFGMRSDTMRFLPKGMNLRQSFGAAYRLGTGEIDSPSNYLDLETGGGQNDIEARSFTDIIYGKRFFTSVIARYAIQLADQQLLRITDQPEQVFAQQWRERLVDRNLGDQLEIEVTPRLVLGDFFSVGAQYLFRRKAEDTYAGTFSVPASESGLGAPMTLDASTLRDETAATEQRIGVGLTFSTLAAHRRGKAKLPIELQYFNSRTISGSGGNVPKLSIHQVQIRLYPRR